MLTAPVGTKAMTRAVRACLGLQKPVQAVRYSTRTEPAEESWAPRADPRWIPVVDFQWCWWILNLKPGLVANGGIPNFYILAMNLTGMHLVR